MKDKEKKSINDQWFDIMFPPIKIDIKPKELSWYRFHPIGEKNEKKG